MGKLIEIDGCDACPHFDEDGQFCHNADRKFSRVEFADKHVIPGWCPLADASGTAAD